MERLTLDKLREFVGRAATRRVALAALAAKLAVLGGAPPAEAAFICRGGGFPCSRNQQCCAGTCNSDGTCGCNRKGKRCISGVGLSCCSKKCRNGKCK